MRSNLETVRGAPSCTDVSWSGFSVLLAKSEIIGAEVTVTRSKSPSLVGVCGTVVLETKATLQIVNRKSQLKSMK